MFSKFSGANTRLTPAGVVRAAQAIGVTPRGLRTIIKVETGGHGYQSDGNLNALFEPHRFYKELLSQPAKLQAAIRAGLAYKNWGEKPYPHNSYPHILAAIAIDETAALRAVSWGLPQVLGSNCKMCGFSTPQAMVSAMADSEDAQVFAMAKFLNAAGLVQPLNDEDWDAVARGYNGSKYARNHYQDKLQTAFDSLPEEGFAGVTTPLAAVPQKDSADGVIDQPKPIAPNSTTATALYVQQRLQELGYHAVGTPDGDVPEAGWTEAAILDYKNSFNHAFPEKEPLVLNPLINDALLLALPSGPAKSVPPARATATADTLKPTSRIINQTGQSKLAAQALAIPAALAAAGNGIITNIGNAKAYIAPVQDMFSAIPAWGWSVGVLAIAYFFWQNASKVESFRVDMTNKGTAL